MSSDQTVGPNRERVARELSRLEQRINETIALVARLRRENAELQARLAAAERVRAEAANRVQALLDRIDGLG